MWGFAVRVTDGSPLTSADVRGLDVLGDRMMKTLGRIELEAADIRDILHPEETSPSLVLCSTAA